MLLREQDGKGKDSKKRARENMGGPIDVEAGCSTRPDQYQKSTAAAQLLGRKRRRKFGRESIAVKEVRGSWEPGLPTVVIHEGYTYHDAIPLNNPKISYGQSCSLSPPPPSITPCGIELLFCFVC